MKPVLTAISIANTLVTSMLLMGRPSNLPARVVFFMPFAIAA